jgi:hypothetical protein
LTRSNHLNAAAAAGLLFLPLLWLLATGRFLTMDDLALFHVPVRFLYAEALASGASFAWTSALASGFYLHGEGQAGMLHPLHLALYSALPLTAAFNLELILNYAFALVGARLMLGRFGMTPAASYFGAMSFAFSGFNLMHLMHVNAIAVAAHLPWLIVAADDVLTSSSTGRRRIAGAAFAGLLGSAILLGFPQFVLLNGIAVALFVLWRVRAGAAAGGLLWLAAGAILGVGVGAVQLIPMLDATTTSLRNQASVAFSMTYSVHPLNVLQFLTPYVFRSRAYFAPGELSIHEAAVYSGAFCTLAIVWAVVLMPRKRPIVVWALVLCLLSAVLALGRYGGLYYLLASLPGFSWFRAPGRFTLLLHFGMSIVAAAVFDDLVKRVRAREPLRARLILAVGIPVVLSAAIAVGGYALTGRGITRGARSVAFVAGTGALMALAARGRREALMLIPIVAAVDLGYWGYSYLWQGRPATLAELTRAADVPPGRPNDLLYLPAMSNLPVLAGYRVSNAYVALFPSRVLDLDDPAAQRVAGVAWRRTPDEWEQVELPMPRVRIVYDARATDNPRRDLGGVNIERVALVASPVTLGGRLGEARVLLDRGGRMGIDVFSDGRGLLVTTERYHRGWRATTAGGASLPVVRVNGDYIGIVIEAGRSTVALTFEPASLRLGWWVSGLSLLLLSAAAASVVVRKSRARASADDTGALRGSKK